MRQPLRSKLLGLAALAALSCGGGSNDSTGGGGSSGNTASADSGKSAASGTSSAGGTGAAAPGSTSGGAGSGGGNPGSSAAAAIFFTDLMSGPNTGGENGKGAFVTLYGHGFGDKQGGASVTVGDGVADNYPVWSDGKITLQLGSKAKSGDVVVHLPGRSDSNSVPFVVRSGSIYFVTSSGDDHADGTFSHPWKTIPQAKNAIHVGDIAYLGTHAGDALSQTTEDESSPYNCALGMSYNDGSNSGTAEAPKALVAYPGAKVTVGVESGLERGLLTPAITGSFDYWVIAGIAFRGAVEAVDFEGSSTGWRMVGNDMSCPNGTGLSGCVNGAPDHFKFYGNVVHDAAANVPKNKITKYYHGIYFGGSNHLELGWNEVRDGNTCRGIQFHDSEGPNNYDLIVHDNLVHGTTCDGINFATVDPSQGPVQAYNNVVYDVGNGPDPKDGSSNYAGIYVANITNVGSPGSGDVEIFDNTLYNCGSRGGSAAGAIALTSGSVGARLVDNLVVALKGESYLSSDSDASAIKGTNNLFFGAGTAPAGLAMSVTSDPLLEDPSMFDFRLRAGSPAIDAGAATAAKTDYDGTPRPQGKAFDIGAFELR